MWIESPVYNADVDTNKNGMYEGFLRRQLIGGSYYTNPIRSGSRAGSSRLCGTSVSADITTRGCK